MYDTGFIHRRLAGFAVVALAALVVAPVSVRSDGPPSRKSGRTLGITGQGFVRDASGAFSTIDAPRAGLFTVVFGMNDDGRVVGGYVDTRGRLHGFLRTEDTFTRIDVPGATATFGSRINANGQIVGAYSDDDPNLPALELPRGFLLDNGVFTKIDVPGAVRTQPFGINNHGQIVGEYVDATGASHGFLLNQGTYTTFDAPGGIATLAFDIDDGGRIVGTSFDAAARPRGFLRDEQGAFTPIEAPDALRGTLAVGINNRGQVVGVAMDLVNELRTIRAFVLESGTFTTIAAPAATLDTVVLDITDQGELAGVYDLASHGYIRDGRGFTIFGSPEGNINEVVGINGRDQIVGRFVDANGTNRGFLQNRRGFSPIDVPGANATATYKINDRGQIVGGYSTVGNNTGYPTHGYLLDAGEFTTIDVPGAQHTIALDINNRGVIVGEYQDGSGIFHGFVRDRSGAFTTVDVPGTTRTSITGLNDRDQMVGQAVAADGTFHSFLVEEGVIITTIGTPGSFDSIAPFAPIAINNRGQIVGVTFDGVRFRSYVLDNGIFTRITVPGVFFGGFFATDIDDRGRIAGTSL